MNYGKKSLRRRKNELNAKGEKRLKRGSLFATHLVLLGIIGVMIVGSFAAYGVLQGIIDSAPAIGDIDVSPKGYSSFVYDADGNQTAKLVSTDSNRIPVSAEGVPQMVRNCFVVIEDERFYSHNGIDIYGIIRAAVKDITSGFKISEGASTITQQLIKNNVFEGWTSETKIESVKRKIQEQYLAIHLEKDLKDKGEDAKTVILINYLNTINLGHNTLGIQAASNRYFDKDVKDLTLAEASVLAAIPQNPTEFDPINNPDRNNERRQTVLTKLQEKGLITKDEFDQAAGMEVYDEIRNVNVGKTREE
ncbi:MAG: transglycosylase domain-containing protein, partial [bacterium]